MTIYHSLDLCTGKRTADITRVICIDDALDHRIRAGDRDKGADNEGEDVEGPEKFTLDIRSTVVMKHVKTHEGGNNQLRRSG